MVDVSSRAGFDRAIPFLTFPGCVPSDVRPDFLPGLGCVGHIASAAGIAATIAPVSLLDRVAQTKVTSIGARPKGQRGIMAATATGCGPANAGIERGSSAADGDQNGSRPGQRQP